MTDLSELQDLKDDKKWFGRMPAPDERDQRFLMKKALRRIKPDVDWRYWYPPRQILDQGPHPHCVGFAFRHFLENSPVRTRDAISPQDIYHRAQKIDEWPGEDYDGTSVRAGLKVLQQEGHIAQYLWAYDTQTLGDWILSDDGTRRGPVVLGTAWHEQMSYPDDDGVVELEGSIVGGHAYLCIGYNRNTGLFTFLNSWGRNWGKNGRFRIYEDDVQKLLSDWGEAAAAVEQPVVRPAAVKQPATEPAAEKPAAEQPATKQPVVRPAR